ncbi:MAG TPA: phosphotransferase [Streptosporangiaceae bacterium]
MTLAPEALTGLLARWGVAPDAILPAERGTNNRTFAVLQGDRRWALRVSQNLSAPQVRAEVRLLGRLRRAGLPFAVPEPVPALDGGTVAETPAGPATLCPWLPGVRPDLAGEPALEHQVTLLETAAARVEGWRSRAASELPVQVVHGDLGSSNLLADERTGQVAAVLDFEIAGADFRVQDLVAALLNSGVLDGPDWARRTAALLRGHASALRLTEAEIQAVPDLLLTRAVGSVLWRAGGPVAPRPGAAR